MLNVLYTFCTCIEYLLVQQLLHNKFLTVALPLHVDFVFLLSVLDDSVCVTCAFLLPTEHGIM